MTGTPAFMERFRAVTRIYMTIIDAGFSLLYTIVAPLTSYMAYLCFFKMGGGEKYIYIGAGLVIITAFFLRGAYVGLRDAWHLYRAYIPPAPPESDRPPIDSRRTTQFEKL